MKRVIYIGYQPLNSKVYTDFFLDASVQKGFEVEYWDISQIYFPKIKFDNQFHFDGIKIFKSFAEIKKALFSIEVKSTIFFINITYHFRVWRLFTLLTSYHCTLGFFARGMQPSPEKAVNSKLKEILTSFDIKRVATGIKNRLTMLLKKYQFVKPYDLIFQSGSENYTTSGVGYQFDMNRATFININYFDYDKYLDIRADDTIMVDTPYIVFLDEYLPHHPDVEMTGIGTVEADKYYLELNRYFDYIEKKYSVPVVIAAHPKAQKYKLENPFVGRTLFFNKTCELAKNAMFAMTHHSTSISYPILFKKPIVFITSTSQQERMPFLWEQTLHFGQYLNSKVVFFDKFNENEELSLFVDNEKYDDYKYKYLTSKESENRKSSDIFIDTIAQV